jgi:hypothetical protein
LPCSQEPSTGPYPETHQSSPYRPILFILKSIFADYIIIIITLFNPIRHSLLLNLFRPSHPIAFNKYLYLRYWHAVLERLCIQVPTLQRKLSEAHLFSVLSIVSRLRLVLQFLRDCTETVSCSIHVLYSKPSTFTVPTYTVWLHHTT